MDEDKWEQLLQVISDRTAVVREELQGLVEAARSDALVDELGKVHEALQKINGRLSAIDNRLDAVETKLGDD